VTARGFGFSAAILVTAIVVVVAVVAMMRNSRPAQRSPANERMTTEIFYPADMNAAK